MLNVANLFDRKPEDGNSIGSVSGKTEKAKMLVDFAARPAGDIQINRADLVTDLHAADAIALQDGTRMAAEPTEPVYVPETPDTAIPSVETVIYVATAVAEQLRGFRDEL